MQYSLLTIKYTTIIIQINFIKKLKRLNILV